MYCVIISETFIVVVVVIVIIIMWLLTVWFKAIEWSASVMHSIECQASSCYYYIY